MKASEMIDQLVEGKIFLRGRFGSEDDVMVGDVVLFSLPTYGRTLIGGTVTKVLGNGGLRVRVAGNAPYSSFQYRGTAIAGQEVLINTRNVQEISRGSAYAS